MNANLVVRWLGFLFVATMVAAVGLIAVGTFDPQPIGELRQVVRAPTIALDADGVQWIEPLPHNFSVRAALNSAETPYALLLGNPDRYLAIAIDPASGFMSIWQQEAGQQSILIPWQTWVHVQRESENELWVDLQDDGLTLRINRELFRQSPNWRCDDCRVGIWIDGDAASTTRLIESLEIYYP